ncbi:hypothetical protein [Nocardia grenadensis]|uniref:hypothetical protein n=1 Tax=Nocardia grenadensis TaxID=931537 RepID=UPI003D709A19
MASVHTRLSRTHIWLLTLSSMACALAIAAMAALHTALPEIAADTGATQQQLTWVIDGDTSHRPARSCSPAPWATGSAAAS